MLRKYALILVLVLLAGGGALVTLGDMDRKVDLSSLLEMWGDALRDVDQVATRPARVSDEAEMRFGRELSSRLLYTDDPVWTPYVADVGAALVPYVRRHGIRYEFHAVQGSQINAFAIPGGHVYIFTGMLAFLQSEAELAAILGHEMSHVDLRHSIERYQFELAARKAGLQDAGKLADFARLPLIIAYRQYDEIEADQQGVRLSLQAGYDPSAAAVLFARMHKQFNEPDWQRAPTPQGEMAATVTESLAGWFRSHPPSDERTRRLGDTHRWKGREVYQGAANYQQRIAKSKQEFPGEKYRL